VVGNADIGSPKEILLQKRKINTMFLFIVTINLIKYAIYDLLSSAKNEMKEKTSRYQ
jgi:hypothetical protein